MAALVAVAAIGFTACGSSAASPGKVVCPTTDKYSCYYSGSNGPVHGPRTVNGNRVVGLLPKYCTEKASSCSPTGIGSFFESGPPGEYLGWQIRKSGPGKVVEVYITKAEEQTRDLNLPPTG
jgi:hypothetical protein